MKRRHNHALVIAGPYLGAKVTARPILGSRPAAHKIVDGDFKGRWVALSPEQIRVIRSQARAERGGGA